MKSQVTMLLGLLAVLSAPSTPLGAQEPPPATPPPPVTQRPIAPAPESPADVTAPAPLSPEELKDRRTAIFIMEGAVINAVKSAARNTADELRRIQPGLMMFSSAPAKAHGIYLDGYGVLFQVEIPSVIPSVASLVETLGRDALNRERGGRGNSPAQPMSLGGAAPDAVMDPDAHYVASVQAELINVMVRHSQSLELRPGELLIVSARDASEVPGQVAPPSTMTLSVKATDVADYAAGRLSLAEVRKRVVVRGY